MLKRIIEKFILWYLKKNNKCFITHGKYGWKVRINFYKDMTNLRMEEHTSETIEKYK